MNNPSEVYVVHVPSARNVGDALSNPLKHFRMQHKVLSIGKPDLVYQIPSGSTVIFGGGGLIGEKPAWDAVLNNIANRTDIKKVLWGAGFNRSLRGGSNLEQIPLQHKELFSKFDLLGIRDVIEGLDWVPCASCMSEAFDLYPNSRSRRISIYLHGDRIKGLQKKYSRYD